MIVPGSAGFVYKNDLGQVSDYHARNGYYFIRLKPNANDVEFNIPVPRVHITDGKKRWIKAIVIETEGETNNVRIDKLEVISTYDTPIKSVSGAAKNFQGRKVNTFDLGGRYAFGGGLTVRLLLDNWDTADERYLYIDYITITDLYN